MTVCTHCIFLYMANTYQYRYVFIGTEYNFYGKCGQNFSYIVLFLILTLKQPRPLPSEEVPILPLASLLRINKKLVLA